MRRRGVLTLGLAVPVLAACSEPGNGDVGSANRFVSADGSTLRYEDPAERPDGPRLDGENLEGESIDAAQWRGEIVVVNFWASWCAPCRKEGPDLMKSYEETADDGVRFLGINIRDDRDKAIAFEEGLGVTYPSIFDPSGRLALAFEDVPPNTIPATIILDREGRIAAVFRTVLTADLLITEIRKVV